MLSTLVIAFLVTMILALEGPAAVATPPGRNGEIAFESQHFGCPSFDLAALQPVRDPVLGGATGRILINSVFTNHQFASWSPLDGRVAYAADAGGNWDLWILGEGGGITPLSSSAGSDTAPAWSPDGSKIAFDSDEAGNWNIYTVKPDGSGRTPLTTHPAVDAEPSWSPDGSKITFGSDRAGHMDIWVMDASRQNPKNLTADIDAVYEVPITTWAPDGKSILFTAPNNGGWMDIWSMNPDGSSKTNLTNSNVNDVDPAWSPDGKKIAFASDYQGDFDIWIMDANGGNLVNMTWDLGASLGFAGCGGDEFRPDWRPLPLDGPLPPAFADQVGLVDPNTGIWHLRKKEGQEVSFYYGNPGDYPIIGDWDCDGDDTPGLYRQSDGFVYLRNSNTQGVAHLRFFFGNPGDIPIAGDFDGDGCDTVSIYRPSEGRAFIINELGANDGGLGAADYWYYFGNPGDKPFVGDFNADGIDTLGLHRESTGFVYFRNTNTQGIADNQFYFGDPGDRLIAGDWTGDGNDTPGLFRPSNTTVYLRFSNTEGVADYQFVWGQPGWLPVAGDFGID